MPREFLELTADELAGLPRARTVFLFPVGPMEDHGPHLPLGLDLLEASRLATLTAERIEKDLPGWVAVRMPPAPMGLEANTTRAAILVRGHVLRDWLIDSCRSLKRQGFLHFVCFSGHLGPRQLTAIEEAGKAVMRARAWLPFASRSGGPALISASSALVTAAQVKASPLWPDPVEHGGRRDTSVALALGALPGGRAEGGNTAARGYANLPAKPRTGSFWSRRFDRAAGSLAGYWGDPASATEEEGRRVLVGSVDEIFPKLRAALEGTNPNHLFRSWYSVLPPNRTFFKIWMLALGMVLFLAAWTYYTVQGLLAPG